MLRICLTRAAGICTPTPGVTRLISTIRTDPDGLSSICSSQWFLYNGRIVGTVADALNLTTNVTDLAETEYTESGHNTGVDSTDEEDMIGEVIMNRWALVNGYDYLYTDVGRPPLGVSIWGSVGGGIASIVQAPYQFDVWNGSSLTVSAQNNVNHALNSLYGSRECDDLAYAIGSAIAIISSPTVNIYYDKHTNLAPLAFNSGNLIIPSYMQKIGSFGDKNVFYGAPVGEFSPNLIPMPRPVGPRRPSPPRPSPKPTPGRTRFGALMVS
jgi:hypothetical protein